MGEINMLVANDEFYESIDNSQQDEYGIGETKAVQIKAALELSKRIASFKPEKYKIKNIVSIVVYKKI